MVVAKVTIILVRLTFIPSVYAHEAKVCSKNSVKIIFVLNIAQYFLCVCIQYIHILDESIIILSLETLVINREYL